MYIKHKNEHQQVFQVFSQEKYVPAYVPFDGTDRQLHLVGYLPEGHLPEIAKAEYLSGLGGSFLIDASISELLTCQLLVDSL
jgi:hypothetical protein